MRALDPKLFQSRLHHEIPLSSHMKIAVIEVREDRAHVAAPLAPNINHKSTAFGGSVNALAVAACWSLITGYVELQGLQSEYIVIQDSQIDYTAPIATDFYAVAEWESADGQRKFLETLTKKGRARATLKARVFSEAGEGANLTARFAAQLKR